MSSSTSCGHHQALPSLAAWPHADPAKRADSGPETRQMLGTLPPMTSFAGSLSPPVLGAITGEPIGSGGFPRFFLTQTVQSVLSLAKRNLEPVTKQLCYSQRETDGRREKGKEMTITTRQQTELNGRTPARGSCVKSGHLEIIEHFTTLNRPDAGQNEIFLI